MHACYRRFEAFWRAALPAHRCNFYFQHFEKAVISVTLPSERAKYSAIVDRPKLQLPNGERIVIWTIVNVEVWDIARPMPRQVLVPPTGVTTLPDVPNWSWHEYGMRVGFWRFHALYERLKIRPSLSINARVCLDYPLASRKRPQGLRLGVHGPQFRSAADAHRT